MIKRSHLISDHLIGCTVFVGPTKLLATIRRLEKTDEMIDLQIVHTRKSRKDHFAPHLQSWNIYCPPADIDRTYKQGGGEDFHITVLYNSKPLLLHIFPKRNSEELALAT